MRNQSWHELGKFVSNYLIDDLELEVGLNISIVLELMVFRSSIIVLEFYFGKIHPLLKN